MQVLVDGLGEWPSCGGTVTSTRPLAALSAPKLSQLLLPSGFSGRTVCCFYLLRNRTEGQELLVKCFEEAHGRRGVSGLLPGSAPCLARAMKTYVTLVCADDSMPGTASKQTEMVRVQLGLVYDRLELGLSAENKAGIGWTPYQLHLLVCGP